jgi:hypothetical protein
VRRRLLAVVIAAAASLAAAIPASAAWTRLSTTQDSSNIVVPALWPLGGTAFTSAFWRSPSGGAKDRIETATFTIQPDGSFTGLSRATALSEDTLGDPHFLPGAGAQPQIADAGINVAPAFDGTFYMQRAANGTYGAPSIVTGSSSASDPGDGVLLTGGAPAIPSAGIGGLALWVGAADPATQIDLSALDPGTHYIPKLAYDRSGRLWLAWYVLPSADSGKGIWLEQLDPATGNALAGPYHAPASQTISNDGLAIAMACNATCHVVYFETRPDFILETGRIVSWAPGQAKPVVVASPAAGSIGGSLSAAVTAKGRLWVAWYSTTAKGTYVAKLGDGNGAGGTSRVFGQPAATFADAHAIDSVAIGEDRLLVATDFLNSSAGHVWANVVRDFDTSGIPNPVVVQDPSGSAIVPKKVRPHGACLPLKLQAYKPATLTAWLYLGRRGKVRVGKKLTVKYAAPGVRTVCLRIPKQAKGWYKARRFRLVVGFQAVGKTHVSTHIGPIRILK